MSLRVGMVSLGCPKNQMDAELMLARLQNAGFELVAESGLADVVIVNTCGFIEDAKKESIENILEFAQLKKEGRIQKILVTGCLAERYQDELVRELPECDGVLGLGANADIVEAVRAVAKGDKVVRFPNKACWQLEGDRLQTTPDFFAYLRIGDGCDNCCTYCAIPSIRGRLRSRPMEALIAEAEKLAAAGVKELVLVAQDTTLYGVDLYGEARLPALLRRLCAIDGLRWIRLLYCYPEHITDELLEVMAQEPKVAKYMDIPLQHVNGEVLAAMNRPGDNASLRALLAHIREKVPGITLRTTVMVGFPGEGEEAFEELCTFIRDMRFERLGCFAYSQEEDTPAGEREDQLDPELRMHRADLIMEEQMDIAFEKGRELIGQKMEVLVEGYDEDQQMYYGRSYMDAPDIDTRVSFLTEREEVRPGEFIWVEVLDSVGYDLVGREILA